jgi:uncharacterized protein (DUF305 family)
MSKIRYTLVFAAALVTTVTLAACSSTAGSGSMPGMNHGSSATPAPTASANTEPHNDSDVAFAMGMVPHHQQAVEMADMILKKGGIDASVIALAKGIKAAQAPEITLMTGWLNAWGSSPDAMGGMPGMDTGNGMMSNSDMSKLDKATGAAAAKLFLQQMTQHHEGAVTMARTEIAAGKNPAALALAQKVVTDQTAEITQMQQLLASL